MYIDVPFQKKQIECHCGCGQCITHKELVARLWTVQKIIERPLIVTSWNRCEKHNKEVGGKKDSAHIKGWAVDISVTNNIFRYRLIVALWNVGFDRLGIGPNFIHADIDPDKRPGVIWLYSDRR